MKLRLWRGFHSDELFQALRTTWTSREPELLIACPPHRDGSKPEHFDFLAALPHDVIEWLGDWSQKQEFPLARGKANLHGQPVLGVFTSGTVSGKPRLVLYSRENIESSVGAIARLFDLERVREVFCYAQPFHTFGLTLGYVFSLLYDVQLITPNGRYDKSAHEKRLALKSPSLMTLGTPTHFHDLLTFGKSCAIAPSYSCIAGGASVSLDLWRRLRDELHIEAPSIGYGCTEASPGITHVPPGREPSEDNEIGFPLENLKARPTPEGVDITGRSLCLAIIEGTELRQPEHLVIRDRVRVRADGVWIYEGRHDLQLNRGGEKFSLENIEASLAQALNIQAVAVAVPDARLGEDLGLLVHGALDDARLRRLTEHLAATYRLRLNAAYVQGLESFPMSPSFKIDRQAARATLLA